MPLVSLPRRRAYRRRRQAEAQAVSSLCPPARGDVWRHNCRLPWLSCKTRANRIVTSQPQRRAGSCNQAASQPGQRRVLRIDSAQGHAAVSMVQLATCQGRFELVMAAPV